MPAHTSPKKKRKEKRECGREKSVEEKVFKCTYPDTHALVEGSKFQQKHKESFSVEKDLWKTLKSLHVLQKYRNLHSQSYKMMHENHCCPFMTILTLLQCSLMF